MKKEGTSVRDLGLELQNGELVFFPLGLIYSDLKMEKLVIRKCQYTQIKNVLTKSVISSQREQERNRLARPKKSFTRYMLHGVKTFRKKEKEKYIYIYIRVLGLISTHFSNN